MLNAPPFVSVIVPAFNEERRIHQLLTSLLQQTYPADAYEILVIDNGSTDRTPALVRATNDPRVNLIQENTIRNPDAARNRGLAAARGAIFAFTDADCVAEATWLENAVLALQSRSLDLVAGRIRFSVSRQPGISEIYDSLSFLQHDLSVALRQTAFTANLLVKRDVFEKTGPFEVLAGWNGDAWFSSKATALGFALGYESSSVIVHPARSFIPRMKKVFRIGSGQARVKIRPAQRRSIWSKPHLRNCLPWHLTERVKKQGHAISPVRQGAVWLFGLPVIVFGLVSLSIGYFQLALDRGFAMLASFFSSSGQSTGDNCQKCRH